MPDVIDIAASHLGEHGNKFWSYCGNNGQAWCAAFISTVLAEAGEGDTISNKRMTSVAQYRDYFQSKDAYRQKGTYTPQPGDIVIMKTDSGTMGSHVALVTKVYPDGSFDTIEGNRGGNGSLRNTVITDHYSGTESYISGYGIPQYNNPPEGGGNYSSVGTGSGFGEGQAGTGGNSMGVGLYDYVDYTPLPGDTWESIAQKFGVSVADLLALNGCSAWDPVPSSIKIPTSKVMLEDGDEAGTDSVQKAHTKTVKVYHPIIEAEFYAEGGMLSAVGTLGDDRVYGDVDMDFDIISCTTQRSISADCASMSITLTNRRDWYNILASNDLVIVKMRRPEFGDDAAEYDEPLQETFIGVIDDIRKSLDFSSGQPRRAIQVTARSMAKAFLNFDIGLIENISINSEQGFIAGLLGGETGIIGVNSCTAIQHVWDAFVGKGLRYQFYSGSLEDYIKYEGTPRAHEIMKDWQSYTMYSGSLWNFIKELSNVPFNESFWEIKDGKEVLIHRQTPFNPDDWKSLNRRTIRDDDIVVDSTGRSDLETYTVYIVNMRFLGTEIRNLYNPLWYRPFYEKYGLSQLAVTTTYEADTMASASTSSTQEDGSTGDAEAHVNTPEGTDTDVAQTGSGVSDADKAAEAMRMYATDLFNWNIKNNVFANGQIVVKGRASYKIGEIIVLEYNNLEFYVEGVSHNFTVYGGWTTTLSVTRGIEPENRFTAPWGMAEEMNSNIMSAIVNMTTGAEIDWTTIEEAGSFTLSGGTATGTPGYVNGQWTGTTAGNGETINIPEGIGTYYTHMGWSCIKSKNSAQYKLRETAGEKYAPNGIAVIDGRYVVAVTPKFGKVGDYLTIRMQNGYTIQAIIGDVKGTDAKSEWGHTSNGKTNVVEFVVNKESGKWGGYGGSMTPTQALPDLKNNKTASITNTGNYWDAHGMARPG